MCYYSAMEKDSKLKMPQQREISPASLDPERVTECLLSCLNNREQDVVRSRWALNSDQRKTLEEIGEAYGITRERVRQIECASLQKIKRLVDYKHELEQITKEVDKLLERFGGVIEEQHLLQEIVKKIHGEENHVRVRHNKNRLIFLFKQFMHEFFHFFDHGDVHKEGWSKHPSYTEKAKEALKKIEKFLHTSGKSVAEEDIAQHLNVAVDAVYSYLKLSAVVEQNPFGLWGLISWPDVRAKRMADRIYAVLKRYNTPLHYKDVALYIGKHYNRPINPPTVHNELIADDRFVLVGRGMYALKERGYSPGTVAEIVEQVLTGAGHPLSKKELICEVKRQRVVAPSTILLAVNNSDKVERVGKDRYALTKSKFQSPNSK